MTVTALWSREGCQYHTLNQKSSQIWISLRLSFASILSEYIQTAATLTQQRLSTDAQPNQEKYIVRISHRACSDLNQPNGRRWKRPDENCMWVQGGACFTCWELRTHKPTSLYPRCNLMLSPNWSQGGSLLALEELNCDESLLLSATPTNHITVFRGRADPLCPFQAILPSLLHVFSELIPQLISPSEATVPCQHFKENTHPHKPPLSGPQTTASGLEKSNKQYADEQLGLP